MRKPGARPKRAAATAVMSAAQRSVAPSIFMELRSGSAREPCLETKLTMP